MNLSQHPPRRNHLLDRCWWWKPLSIEATVVVRRLVDPFDARHAQHRQTPGVLYQFVTAQDRLWIWAAYHNRILADSLLVRHPKRKPVTLCEAGETQVARCFCGCCQSIRPQAKLLCAFWWPLEGISGGFLVGDDVVLDAVFTTDFDCVPFG
jgi:hypothetical protein